MELMQTYLARRFRAILKFSLHLFIYWEGRVANKERSLVGTFTLYIACIHVIQIHSDIEP